MHDLKQIVAQNITLARDQIGLNQSDAARRLGIDRPRLIGMEKGERPVDAAMLVTLAQLYGTSLINLVTPQKTNAPSAGLRFRNANEEALEPSEKRVVNQFRTFLSNYAELLGQTDTAPETLNLIPMDSRASSRTRKFAVEGHARQLRALWGISESSPIGERIFYFLEQNGIAVYKTVHGDTELSGASALHEGTGATILVNLTDRPDRQVFTAAHELAHLLYHLAPDAQQNEYVSKKFDKAADEHLANEFASAFLMPGDAIKEFLARRGALDEQLTHLDVIALQRHFLVSYAAMLVRLKKLGIVKGGGHFNTLKEIQPVIEAEKYGYVIEGWELNYAPTLQRPNGLPDRYVQLVLRTNEEGLLNEAEAARYLEMDTEDYNFYLVKLRDQRNNVIKYGKAVISAEFKDAEFSVS
jgi:Zn-dependent peptidase ImmA (M78 family)/DNA-binding XRE family transcriptional regulator